MMKIGLFYGSSTCYTEMVAEKIRDILGEDLIDLHNIKDTAPELMEEYSVLILGIPTWDFGELQEDWQTIWDHIPSLNLQGKIVAMYGMGDQIDYSEWFLDALGMLYHHLLPSGVHFIGFWPTEGYQFTSPKPLTDNGSQFVGLALDDVNQYEQTDERLSQWCIQILQEIEPLL
ncbi:Flavodoxin [Photorhabdus australis subsp. thailandensis]|uniref:Flavodoxin n=2 Tax=Photorhabdus australis TaxID=286156 RepID=A0A1C0U5R1_9GAMM|nr:Flavodoxin [Photorhabdus australis subsp. thailandensis]